MLQHHVECRQVQNAFASTSFNSVLLRKTAPGTGLCDHGAEEACVHKLSMCKDLRVCASSLTQEGGSWTMEMFAAGARPGDGMLSATMLGFRAHPEKDVQVQSSRGTIRRWAVII